MKNVMIDIETLGTGSDALIVSIGAVRFGDQLGKEFYMPCFHQQKERKMDLSTVRWWMKQGDEGRKVFEEDAVPLKEALIELRDFLNRDEDKVWANGVTFDIGILQDALIQCKLKFPWKYSNVLCLRSIRAIYPEYDRIMKDLRGESASHNALDDAKCQAKALILLSQLQGFSLDA